MIIKKAVIEDQDQIVDLINKSDLGSVYFNNDKSKIEKIISKEIDLQNVVIGVNGNSEFIAVLNYNLKGAFDMHPYIHILAISNEHRGKSYGSQMMHYFESFIVPEYKKIFLLVGNWNSKAETFYTKLGYRRLCEIEGFYSENVTEVLMVKERFY